MLSSAHVTHVKGLTCLRMFIPAVLKHLTMLQTSQKTILYILYTRVIPTCQFTMFIYIFGTDVQGEHNS
jgi:hypothetical protein